MKKTSINLTQEQRDKLEDLWFVFGNYGPKHSHANHRFIQVLLEEGSDSRKFFKPDKECISAVDKIINVPNQL